MDEALLFAMDSEPIPCDEMQDTFNTKYAECILKLNATILLNGFIVHGGKIWVGTVTDHTLGQIDGIQDVLAHNGARCLVDGGYTQSRYLETPWDSPEIHPLRLRPGQTIEQYKAEAHEKKGKHDPFALEGPHGTHFWAQSPGTLQGS